MFRKLTLDNDKIKPSWKLMFLDYLTLCETDEKYKSNLNDIETILEEQSRKPKMIYPPQEKIFAAFEFFEVSECKVIILGQDPYHQHGQAMGLSFSVPNGVKIPPSLTNIYKEIINDDLCTNTNEMPTSGDLTHWAEQGVLLLNTALTVKRSCPNIHSKQWELFTDFVIKWLAETSLERNLVFMLWGTHAKKKKKFFTHMNRHYAFEANHPSPLSANRGGWFGCGHFGKTAYMIKW